MKFRFVEWLDEFSHALGLHWDWVCDWYDRILIHGWPDLEISAGKIRSAEGKFPPEELEPKDE